MQTFFYIYINIHNIYLIPCFLMMLFFNYGIKNVIQVVFMSYYLMITTSIKICNPLRVHLIGLNIFYKIYE